MTGGVWQYGRHVAYVLAVTVTLLVLRRVVKRYGGEVAERVALVVLILLPLWSTRLRLRAQASVHNPRAAIATCSKTSTRRH